MCKADHVAPSRLPLTLTSAPAEPLLCHHRKMNLTRGIDLQKIANMMSNASGAELKGCCTESGMFALRERRVHVTQEDFEMAVAKVMKKVRGAGHCGWAGIGDGQPAQGACCTCTSGDWADLTPCMRCCSLWPRRTAKRTPACASCGSELASAPRLPTAELFFRGSGCGERHHHPRTPVACVSFCWLLAL